MTRPDAIAVAYDCLFPYTTGGGERQYRAVATWIAARGTRVDYLTATQWDDDDAPAHGTFTIVPITGRLALHNANGVRRSAAALAFAAGLFRGLLRRRRSYRAVIVSGLPVLNVFAARLALLGSGTRIIVDYLEVWGRRQWIEYAGRATGNFAWLLQRLAIAVTPTATAHSQLTARRLRAEGLRGRVLVSPGLIDPSPKGHTALTAAAHPPYVLYVGRHIPDKRVESLPAAVSLARRSHPDLRLVIVGQGPSGPLVDAAIESADAAEWTERPGFVSQARLEELMSAATVLVNPSRREGYGLVVVEAAASGTPTVLVADPGNASTELIAPGVNGYVAPSVDPEALARELARVASAGEPLRTSTRAWYVEATRTRTVERTVDAILADVYGSEDEPRATARP